MEDRWPYAWGLGSVPLGAAGALGAVSAVVVVAMRGLSTLDDPEARSNDDPEVR